MRFTIILSLLISYSYAADEKKFAVETEEKVPKRLQKKYPHVQFKTPKNLPKPDVAPMDEREHYFSELGLKQELIDLDEADKDVLHWRLKNSSLTKLKDWYPRFPQTVWSKLQAEGKK